MYVKDKLGNEDEGELELLIYMVGGGGKCGDSYVGSCLRSYPSASSSFS